MMYGKQHSYSWANSPFEIKKELPISGRLRQTSLSGLRIPNEKLSFISPHMPYKSTNGV